MQRVQLEPGYVLSRRAWRETSALIEVFTVRHGRVGMVARGVRGARAKRAASLQCFQRYLLTWAEGGELATLSAYEPDGAVIALSGEAVFYGWYLNELLLRLLTRHDPHPALFPLYETTLRVLAGPRAEESLRVFEKRLLAELGYGLPLPRSLKADQYYELDWEHGARMTVEPGADAYPGSSLIALVEERLETREALQDARRLLRGAIDRQLGGRPLDTPRLLRELRRSLGGPVAKPPD